MASIENLDVIKRYDDVLDPLQLKQLLWPEVTFYDKEIEVIYSVLDNDETFVVAGNMLGLQPLLLL